MSARKILATGLLFLLTYTQVGAFSLFGSTNVTSIDKASYAKNIFTVALRSAPGFDGEKTFTVKSGVGGEIIGKSQIVDGAEWLYIQYTPEVSGWIRAKLVARENYYVMSSDTKTVFLRERISLAGTTQDICDTSTPVTATNVVTSFRPETPVFTYTPSGTTTDTGTTEVTTTTNVVTSFRPETPVFIYTPTVTTTDTGTIEVTTDTSVVTSFRPETPIFKYIVDEAVSTTIDNPIVQTVAGMILTSFRPETAVFTYTPSGTTTNTGTTEVTTTTNVVTSFRPETPVFIYTPSGTTTDTGTTEVTTDTSVVTSFRPETPVYTYTPIVTYSCQSIQ